MSKFKEWCTTDEEVVNGHDLCVLTAQNSKLAVGSAAVAATLPGHYASQERIIGILKKLGKQEAARYLEQKLPDSKTARSGDLGEILATNYVAEQTTYFAPVNRLRWKDHRNMAMRGDDLIAIRKNAATQRIEFLKAEIKSRVALSKSVLDEARVALRKDNNRPSPHALSFIIDRLYEEKKTDLADAIEIIQLKEVIKISEMEHLMFVFSGNDPTGLLKRNLERYGGRVHQRSVGLKINTHQQFVEDVYETAKVNANNN
jgi:hypothetical protein